MMIILSILFLALSVAFYTLFERKILSLSQGRVGPNQTILMGILQPVLDGVKLLTKEYMLPLKVNSSFLLVPALMFLVMLLLWLAISSSMINPLPYSLLYLLALVGASVYTTLLSGWLSYSKYASIGSVRSISQSISYEILLTILFLSVIGSLSLQSNSFLFLALILWSWSILSESNRSPFDFSEGESELISGFNVEYGSSGFVLLFLSEYGMMIFFSMLSGLIFNLFIPFLIFFILIRSVLPRFRYDKLMELMWMIALPLVSFILLLQIYL